MKYISLLLIILLGSFARSAQAQIKTVDQIVDSLLIRNSWTKLPDSVLFNVEIKQEGPFTFIGIAPKEDWYQLKRGFEHMEMLDFYIYTLDNGAKLLIENNIDASVNFAEIFKISRLKKLNYKSGEEAMLIIEKLGFKEKEIRPIWGLRYMHCSKPEMFQWYKMRKEEEDEYEDNVVESAKEVAEEIE